MSGHLKSKSVNDCIAFVPRSSTYFSLLLFLFAAVKHERLQGEILLARTYAVAHDRLQVVNVTRRVL